MCKTLLFGQVDFIFGSSKQVNSLRKILNSYTAASGRQTIFASASIPQHNRFVHDCVQHKWTKVDLTFIHLSWTVGIFFAYTWWMYSHYCLNGCAFWTSVLVFTHVCLVFVQSDVVHVHVNPLQPMPSHLNHTYVVSIILNGLLSS
jgi:hypothetical protein